MTESKNKRKKKAATGVAAVTTAAAVLVSGLFDAPSDIAHGEDDTPLTAIVQMVDTDGSDDGSGADDDENGKKSGIRSRIRKMLLNLPLGVRLFLLIPLWCLGWLIVTPLMAVGSAVLPALGSAALKWILTAALFLAVILLGIKTFLPDVPLKKVLKKKNLVLVLVVSGLLGAASTILGYAYPEKPWLIPLVNTIASGFVLLFLFTAIHRRKSVRAKAASKK